MVDKFCRLIEKYIENSKIHYNIEYSNKNSVRKGNKAAKKMIEIAKEINFLYPDRVKEFADLLNKDKYKIDIWAAIHILEHMVYSSELENKALLVIKKYANENSGTRKWLENWLSKKKQT